VADVRALVDDVRLLLPHRQVSIGGPLRRNARRLVGGVGATLQAERDQRGADEAHQAATEQWQQNGSPTHHGDLLGIY
jgi:hypothetical protein